MSEQMLMKDGLDREAVTRIARAFEAVCDEFKSDDFVAACVAGLADLELKQRVEHIVVQLEAALDGDFTQVADYLKRLPAVWQPGDINDPRNGFAAWPVIDFVASAGLAQPEIALECLEKLTPLFSAEFAIRAFIETHPETTFSFLYRWLNHEDEHVRRLVSEGTRPRLPWGKRLQNFIVDPSPILPLLESLKLDPSLYVRRSVANSLNDISKDHPTVVIKLCRRWLNEASCLNEQNKQDLKWLIKHATRSLVKQGHPDSFALLGFTQNPRVHIDNFVISDSSVNLGSSLSFSFDISTQDPQQYIVVDYAVYFQKANGRQSAKVFKLKNAELEPNKPQSFRKSISFKELTTRRYYPGEHAVAIHINGVEQLRQSFLVKAP